MGVVQFTRQVADTLVSLVNNLGVSGKDKAASTEYGVIELSDLQLVSAYRATWLAKKIVDIPAYDSFRKWRSWQGTEEQIGALEAEEKRLQVRKKLLETMIKARLFGGAALYIGTGDSDLMRPLDPARIRKGGVQFLNVMLRRQLNPGEIEYNPNSPWYGMPVHYEITIPGQVGIKIHPSRFVIFKGTEMPDEELIPSVNGRGWGDSVLTSTLRAIKDADGTAANIASLIFEAKVDIIRLPDLMASLADPEYENRLLTRFRLMQTAKGVNGVTLLDKEEEYEQKTITFATLPEILMAFMQIVSGAADIPAVRFLGQSPIGLNSTGESDIRNYYDRIQADQEVRIQPRIETLDECLIYSTFGSRPADLHYVWTSLWQVSDKEKAEIGEKCALVIAKLVETSLYPPEAIANAGANMLVENSIMPGLLEEIEKAGGLPDYEAELAAENEREDARLAAEAANNNSPPATAAAVGDAAPRTLYVRREVQNADDIRKWAREQGFDTALPADDMHVTIAYSREAVDWMKVGNDHWGEDEFGHVRIRAGGARLLEQFGQAVVLAFSSSQLTWRHEDIKRAGATWDHEDFQPHIAITYHKPSAMVLREVEPYRGEIILGPEIFEEITDNIGQGDLPDETKL